MEPAGPLWKLSRRPPKKPLDDYDPELDAPIKGPLFPRPVFLTLLVVFGVAVMLTLDWFALLLLNVEGVRLQMGPLNTLRVTAALMAGAIRTTVPTLVYSRRMSISKLQANNFFNITLTVWFHLGFPSAIGEGDR